MNEEKSIFLVIISWVFILLSPIVFVVSLLISASYSTLLLNTDIIQESLKNTSLPIYSFEIIVSMLQYTSIVFIIILVLSIVNFSAGLALRKQKSWARTYISALFFIKVVLLSLLMLFLLFVAIETSKVGMVGLIVTFTNVLCYLIYKRLSSKRIKSLCTY